MRRWLVVVGAVVVAACDCGGSSPMDADAGPRDGDPGEGDADPGTDGGRDARVAPRDVGPPGSEPCGDGIRRVALDVAPLEDPSESASFFVGRGDRVIVAQSDRIPVVRVGRVTVANADTGERSSVAVSSLPGRMAPLAIRGDGPYEILWYHQFQPLLVQRVSGDAAEIDGTTPSGAEIYAVHAAAATAEGFIAIVQREGGDWALAGVRGTELRYEPLALPVDLQTVTPAPDSYGVALADADERGIVFGVLPTATGEITPEGPVMATTALRIDTRTTPFEVRSANIDLMPRGIRIFTIDATPDGPVIGAYLESPGAGVRFYWLDDALGERARWQSASLEAWPVGAAGAIGAQIVAFEGRTATSDLSLFVGMAGAPGAVVGGGRALVNGLDARRGRRGQGWQRSSGELSLVYWRAGVEVVTLCGGR